MFSFKGWFYTKNPMYYFLIYLFFVEEMLIIMVKKTMDHHVLPNLALTTMVSASFDLWMFHGGVDTFALVINFLNDKWVPMHIIVGLFDVNETIGQSMVVQFQYLLERFGLLHQVFHL
jgi:hypothetical protein